MPSENVEIRGEARDRLLAAAAEAYRQSPELTLDSTCQLAAVSRATAHHHFPKGLREMLGAVYLRAFIEAEEGVFVALCRQDQPTGRNVTDAVVRHIEWFSEHVALAHVLLFYDGAWLGSMHRKALDHTLSRFARQRDEWCKDVRQDLRALPRDLYWPVIFGPVREHARRTLSRIDLKDVGSVLKRPAGELAHAAWAAVQASS